MIDLFRPYIPAEARAAVDEAMHTRWIGQGPKVDEFEKAFETLFHVKHAVSVNSGTSALETAYDLCDLKAGDEVISTPLTCTATNLPLLRRGVKIVWADIDPKTLNISQRSVNEKLTSKTKAVIQVHLGGIPCDIKTPADVPVISDACQALGVFRGDYSCFSFQAIKHITTGDGGIIVCPTEETRHRARLLRWFGIDRDRKIANNWQAYKERKMTFDIEEIGCKRHMTDLQAAMGIEGLKKLDFVMDHRKKIFSIYKQRLTDITGITLIDGPGNVLWLATVLVEDRDNFARVMFEADIDTNVVQVRNDIYKVFGGQRTDLPNMNALEHMYLSIPLGVHVSEEDAHYICDTIRKGW